MPPPPPPAHPNFIDNGNPNFTPSTIIVRYHGEHASMFPADLLPAHLMGTCFTAQNLAWTTFIDEAQKELKINITEKQIMAEVGLPAMNRIKTGRDWRLALQICHDRGLQQCVFHVLDEDVVVKAEPVAHQARGGEHRCGWPCVLAAVGTVGVAAVAGAMQMGYLPGSFLG